MGVQYTIEGDDMSSSIQVPRVDEGVIVTLTFSRAEPDSADDERRALCDVHGQIHDRQEKLLFDHHFDDQWSVSGNLKSQLRSAYEYGGLASLIGKLFEAHRTYVVDDLPRMIAKEDRKAADAESMRQARLARAQAWTPEQAQQWAQNDVLAHARAIANGDKFEAYYVRNDMMENASASRFYDSALRAADPALYERAQNNQSESVTVNVAERLRMPRVGESERAAESSEHNAEVVARSRYSVSSRDVVDWGGRLFDPDGWEHSLVELGSMQAVTKQGVAFVVWDRKDGHCISHDYEGSISNFPLSEADQERKRQKVLETLRQPENRALADHLGVSIPLVDVVESPFNPRAEPAEVKNRQAEIQGELARFGFRMEPSLGVLGGDAHPVMVIATGEMAEDDELTPDVIALASEWSLLENPELAEEHGLDFPPAKAGESGGVQYMGVAQSVKMRPDGTAMPAFRHPAPKVANEWLGGPDELDVTTDASTLLRAAFAYVTTPEKVNVDWLCASLQEAVAKLDKAPSADAPGAGFVLAFPDGTEAEAQEILSTLRYGGNNVVRVVDPSLTTPVLDAVEWYEAMRQDDLDPSAQG